MTHGESRRADRAIIYRSEIDFVSRGILDCPNIETGGELFGFWTAGGIPVVLFAIGPGPNANHQTTFFNQDIGYLEHVGHRLFSKYGLLHIGEWHSHHQLGLAQPSGHDASTMATSIANNHLGRFLMALGNCTQELSVLNAFEFVEGFGTDWRHVPWEIKEVASPFRAAVEADGVLATMLCNPRIKTPRHGKLFTVPVTDGGALGERALPAGAIEFFDEIERQNNERNEEVFDRQRYEAEVALLKRKLSLGVWHFDLNRERPFLAMAVKTKSGNLYTIQIELDRFPQSVPKVFVTRMLRDHDGNPMNEARHSLHTLASEHGWTRICHYGSESWTPGVSLYKIYIKCALWLNIYEVHLKTGKPMEYYLKRQA